MIQDSLSKTDYLKFQNPIAVGSVRAMVDLSQDVTDVAEFDQLLGVEAPEYVVDSFVDVDGSVDSFNGLDACADDADIHIGSDAPLIHSDDFTGWEASVIDPYNSGRDATGCDLKEIVDGMFSSTPV